MSHDPYRPSMTSPPPELTRGEWRNRAACLNHPRLKPEAWDDHCDEDGYGDRSRRPKRIAAAIAVCNACPVRAECLDDVDLRWDRGVRGGVDLRALLVPRTEAS